MIEGFTDVFYYAQPVDGLEQSVSLVEYLNRHGQDAQQDSPDQVIAPVVASTSSEAAAKTAIIHMLITTWRLFWQHCDSGVYDLPIYEKH